MLLSRSAGAALGLLLVLLVGPLLGLGGTADAGDCRREALAQLRASSPNGFTTYERISDPGFFEGWIDCGDAQFDLSTAVHESTHFITSETDAFPLVGGGAIARPHDVSTFFPPSRIANRFETDSFTSIYLKRGKASSADDFLYLLDEFNAYTHDLATAVDLRHLTSPDQAVDHRDGLAAMMAFVEVYAETARSSETDTWRALRQPPAASTVAALWTRAEQVMASSCGIPNFGTSDRVYLRRVCAAGQTSAVAEILGRPPACPSACLDPAADPTAEVAAEPAADFEPDGIELATTAPAEPRRPGMARRPRHPFAGNVGPRRHPLDGD